MGIQSVRNHSDYCLAWESIAWGGFGLQRFKGAKPALWINDFYLKQDGQFVGQNMETLKMIFSKRVLCNEYGLENASERRDVAHCMDRTTSFEFHEASHSGVVAESLQHFS